MVRLPDMTHLWRDNYTNHVRWGEVAGTSVSIAKDDMSMQEPVTQV